MDQEIEIKLEDDTDKDVQKEDIPLYVTAFFIAISGVGFLIFTVYYIAFLPVPAVMQPLRVRVLTTLQLEQALQEDISVITIINIEEGAGLPVHRDPREESEVIGEASKGAYYEKLDEVNDWFLIQDEGGVVQGWIRREYAQEID